MRHWLQLGIRNWRVRPGRTAGAVAAIGLGVGVVVWVTSAYESVRLALRDQTWFWIGHSHLSVESMYGAAGTVYQALTEELADVDNVKSVTARLRYPMTLKKPSGEGGSAPEARVEVVGINPATEYTFRDYATELTGPDSRMLVTGDADGVLVEEHLARQLGLKVGDGFELIADPPLYAENPAQSGSFRVVGIIEHRRIAKQQDPVVVAMLPRVQELAQFDGSDGHPARVTKVDLLLQDAGRLSETEWRVRRIVDEHKQDFLVTSSEAKLRQVQMAEQQTGFVLSLLSSVALFTAFFIILSTLSMGMVERVGQLGLLRCQGVTRIQTAVLVFAEIVPVALLGMILGVPIGIGLAMLTARFAPEYVGKLAISETGILLAWLGGAVTTVAGAGLPVVQAMRVSPLAASRPQSRPTPGVLSWLAAIIGVGLVAAHVYMITHLPDARTLLAPWYAPLLVFLLYGGFGLLTPGVIRLVSPAAVFVVGRVLRLEPRLLADQVGRAAWRSAVICCGLMVGLSLIVSLIVVSRSVEAGWDFHKEFTEAFVFVTPPIPQEQARQIQGLPGILQSCLVNEGIRCRVRGEGLWSFPESRFVAGEPEGFFRLFKLNFVEGNQDDAIAKLNKGGYVIVTPEFVRVNRIGYGRKVRIHLKDNERLYGEFEVAGVVSSPALDMAAKYFNSGGELVRASVFVVLGTFDDAERVFRVPRKTSLFLLNFDLPETPPPPAFFEDEPPSYDDPNAFARQVLSWRDALPRRQQELDALEREVEQAESLGIGLLYRNAANLWVFRQGLRNEDLVKWSHLAPEQRWRTYREELVMICVAGYARAKENIHLSVGALKQQITRDLHRATMLFTSVPVVALIVAALGVANLMMANVASRSRQIAMLRAVGATKWQIVRIVIGEALVLGSLGCFLGIGLGLIGAGSISETIHAIWGMELDWTIPWGWVGIGAAFTLLVCLTAGILPARRAARTNIIDAMQSI